MKNTKKLTALQTAISERAKARKAFLRAKQFEKYIQKNFGCPDDQTVYAVFITHTRWKTMIRAVDLVRQAKAEGRK